MQGERPMAMDNKSLGKFILDGIPPAPRGIPQIEVTFDIDANGILKVTASDKATGRSQHITITASSGLSKEEVEQMRKEAEIHAAEDKQHRDLIDARNTADNALYAAEKVLSEHGDKVSDEIKAEVRKAMDEVRKVKDGDDEPAIRKTVDALSQAVQKIGTFVYEQQAAQAGPEAGSTEAGTDTPPDDNVVDGEVKDG